ncbi:hypothetical protein ACFWZ2_08345 [Streptomyces sp. NPDC059002]|uniref:hypothetical protein n=1 Tax=Streptomyces sp. NPDC059002 TaxID=3346690 RepID=UPI0036B91F24
MAVTEFIERTETSSPVRPAALRPQTRQPISLPRHLSPQHRRPTTNWTRVGVLMAAGALPVAAIPLYILGALPMSWAALLVIPLLAAKTVLIKRGSAEGRLAGHGMVAGLAAVTAYDGLRIPVAYLTDAWPDFIPRLGGWITESDSGNVPVGYLWRYIGDGGGIAVAFFVFCGVLMNFRPSLVRRHPVLLSLGYGVFIWLGLLATVVLLPRGTEFLFVPTAEIIVLSLLGHLIYGAVLGLFLSRIVRRMDKAERPDITTARRTLPTQPTASSAAGRN